MSSIMAHPDERPPIAIGHVSIRVTDIGPATAFFETLGLRPVMQRETMAILELRGGTHLLLFRAKGRPRAGPVRSFDFMVDDVHAAHAAAAAAGLAPTDMDHDRLGGHDYFEVTDPDGHVFTIYSTHTAGRPV
jgi:catechol 2,3-dioxygenase-like lactoylglutathione lyase family enzyme